MNFASFSPVQTALIIVVALAVIGAIIGYLSRRRRFEGYEEIAPVAQELARGLKAEISRDGPDLLVTGSFQGLPTFVRFSNSEHSPAVSIHMRCQASFGMSVSPASAEVPDVWRNPIRSGDSVFDQRFTIRTDQPTQARLLLNKQGLAAVQKLCCSNQTFLNISTGEIELNELTIPSPQTASHLWLHVQSMKSIAEVMQAIPGAEKVRIVQMKRERHLLGRTAIVVGAIAAVILVIFSTRATKQTTVIATEKSNVPEGITPNDALLVKNLRGWRLAKFDDLPPEGASLMRANGYTSPRLTGDFAGVGSDSDVAYLLVKGRNEYRLIIISGRTVRYDLEYGQMAAIGRIPRDAAQMISWNGPAPESISGDGLLVIRKIEDQWRSCALLRS
jgi:hypothetical protein